MSEKEIKRNIIIDILEKPTLKIVENSRVESAQKHIELVHRDYDGTLTLCIAQEGNDDYRDWNQYSFKPQDLEFIVYKFLGEENVYITANGFWNYSRKLKNLRHLKAFVIDLDYYKVDEYKNKTQKQMWNFVKNKERYFFNKVGKPSLVINSGGGLYFMWLIESAHPNALAMWQLCMDELYKRFERYGADYRAKDASHVYRICGSKNAKNNNIVEFIDLEENVKVYQLEHFRKVLLPNQFEQYIPKRERDKFKEEIKKNKSNKKNKITKTELKSKQVANLFTVYKLHHTRVSDLHSLVELRNFEIHKYNCREKLLFYYRYWTCCFARNKKKALEDALELNNSFVLPLSVNEVTEATKSAEGYFEKWEETFNKFCELERQEGRKLSQREMNKFFFNEGCMIFTNDKIIEDLEISQEEMKDLKTIISNKEKNYRYKDERNEKNKKSMKKKRRNESGRTKREQDKYDKMVIIAQMLEEGYKQKDIAKKLKCDTSVVSRYVKELREGKYILEKEELNDEIFEIDNLEQMA